jgi:hypothetical protein
LDADYYLPSGIRPAGAVLRASPGAGLIEVAAA